MGKSSKVVSPRNVDLPSHVVIRASPPMIKKPKGQRKRCLCLTAWLAGLILLCIGVVVVANYLLPGGGHEADQSLSNNGEDICLGDENLEQKAALSHAIVVAKNNMEDETTVDVNKVLKGGGHISVGDVLHVNRPDPLSECYFRSDDPTLRPMIMFLVSYTGSWHHRFTPLEAASSSRLEKTAQVIARLVERSDKMRTEASEATAANGKLMSGRDEEEEEGRAPLFSAGRMSREKCLLNA